MPLSRATWRSTCPASATISLPSMTILTGCWCGTVRSLIMVGHCPRDRLGRLPGPKIERLLLAMNVLDRLPSRALSADALLELEEPVDDGFGSRRTTGHVDVDRDDGVDPLHHGVVVVGTAGIGAVAKRHDPFWISHLIEHAPEYRRLAMCDGADHHQKIRLPRGEAGQRQTEAV